MKCLLYFPYMYVLYTYACMLLRTCCTYAHVCSIMAFHFCTLPMLMVISVQASSPAARIAPYLAHCIWCFGIVYLARMCVVCAHCVRTLLHTYMRCHVPDFLCN